MLPEDPVMLAGFVNMKLRDEDLSLDDFCDKYDVDKEDLCHKLAKAGFSFSAVSNSFR